MPGLKLRRCWTSAAALTLAASCVSTAAFAGAFGIREQSATGQGMSFAGMASGGSESISGMFWNPAIVNEVDAFQSEQHVTGILADSKIKVKGNPPFNFFGNSGNIGEPTALTAGYSAYRINDKLAIGLSTNTPFGLSTDPHSNWGGQVFARSSRVRSINATPTVGYKVNDWFSIGAGVQLQYFDIRLRQAIAPTAGAPSATLKGDDIGVGFTAGATFKPADGTSIGVGFRSMIKQNLDGHLKIPAFAVNQDISAKLKLPETVSVGVRQRVTDEVTLLGGVEWTNWSRLGTIPIKGSAPAQTIPLNYKDGWFFSGGAEYAVSPAWTVRSGVAYEKAPINDKNRTVRLPDDDRWWLSAGASWNYSQRLAFDLGYSFIFVSGKSHINTPLPAPGLVADAKTHINILSVALRYKIGGSAPAVLVTKD